MGHWFQHKVIGSFLGFREEQKAKLAGDPSLTIGDVISVNMTKLEVRTQDLSISSRSS